MAPQVVLAVDVGGSHVKLLTSEEAERRRFESGPELTPQQMVEGTLETATGWTVGRRLGRPPDADPRRQGHRRTDQPR